MVKIIVGADCGNSPKKLFLKDFNIAIAEGNTGFVRDGLSDDIIWEIVGDKVIEGKSAFIDHLIQLGSIRVSELIINNIITHGKEAAVNGTVILENGETHSFCDIYSFTGAKGNSIKSMSSYIIKTT